MPTYEYKCTNDGSTFDIWQEVGTPAPPCPDCGAPTKKVFSPPRVIFKGSGFYVTDLRAEQGGKSGGGKDKAESGDKAETKSDAKTETVASDAKAETKSESESKSETPKTATPKSE